MFENLERYFKLLPLLVGLAAILGTLYNYSIVATFGTDFFYTLTYVDHINSAIIAFGVINLVSLVLELVWSLIFGRSLFAIDLPLNFHPAAIRVSANVTPFGAVSVPA